MKKKLNYLLAKWFQKEWPPDVVSKYMGDYKETFFTYATAPSFRKQAASGGSITALLSYLLTSGQVDGALVCRTFINEKGESRPEFFIATNDDDLLLSQGSKYIAVPFSSQALPLIRDFSGSLAVVALPCDVSILRRVQEKETSIADKITLVISLFCGHNSEPILTDMIVEKLRTDSHRLVSYKYRSGHWRGQLQANFANQEEPITKPFSYFSDYQNLYFFSQRKCHHCFDHTGFNADISAGDIWSLRMKEEPIKHTALVTRNEFSTDLVRSAIQKGILTGRVEPVAEVCEGQARTMPFHYNVSARSKAGRFLNEKIKDRVNEPVNVRDFIVAWMVLFNEKFSRTQKGQKIILSVPKPVLKLYLYFIKFLESF